MTHVLQVWLRQHAAAYSAQFGADPCWQAITDPPGQYRVLVIFESGMYTAERCAVLLHRQSWRSYVFVRSFRLSFSHLLGLPPTKEEIYAFARVCLPVCLSVSKITKNACVDLDEMLRVDRCTRDMKELINF